MKSNFTKEHLEYLRNENKQKLWVNIWRIGVLVAFIIIWEVLTRLEVIDAFIASSPTRIVKTFVELTQNGTLTKHIGVSLYETLAGFVIGTALGYAIAVMLWWDKNIQNIFEPYLVVLNSLPKIALGPLIIIWVGTGKASIITMAVLISVIVTALSMLSGFVETDSGKLTLMRSMGASRLQTFTKLVAPANVPTLMATLKINVGMSWIGSIMGEYLVSKEGLGYLIVYGSQVFRLDIVMTCTIVLCVLAGGMYAVVSLAEKLVTKKY